jgi:hypothetical protein
MIASSWRCEIPTGVEMVMSRCTNHPGRESVVTINNLAYCAQCQTGIVAARGRVDRHVEPKDCFVWYVGNNNWQPIVGTGCAHWVAHQLGIRSQRGQEQCLAGFLVRVATLVQRTREVQLADLRVNDIYVTPPADHTGLVIRIVPAPAPLPGQPAAQPQITIRHDSSGQGRVAENDFATYFHGRGTFRRL